MDAAHGVVGGRMDGGGGFRQIKAITKARLINAREMVFHHAGTEVCHVEEHMRRTGPGDFPNDGSADNITTGEFVGEPLACSVTKERAVAAKGFGQEKARGLVQMKRGGVELDELNIADHRPGAPGHRDAIAGGDIGVRGFFEHAAQTAGGKQRGARKDRVALLVARVIGDGAADFAVGHQQIGNGGETKKAHVGERRRFAIESTGDFAAG